jgi:hypothetical protein
MALQLNLTAIFQMKRGNLRYRYQGGDYTATELYARVQRRMRPATAKARFKTASLEVSIDLETRPNQPPKWRAIRLVFSAPVKESNHDTWVVFACTDTALKDSDILKAYSLRWSIEVYFKELKQNLGFLKEQSGRYQVAYASVNLAAIRYLLLFEAMLCNGSLSYGAIRDRQSGQLQVLTYALLLWELFRALIEGALDDLVHQVGKKVVALVRTAIHDTVEDFLSEALQMKPNQVGAQLKAQELGYL